MVATRTDVTASRPVPFTEERALTEVAQARRYLDGAVRSLELAAEILESLDGADAEAAAAVRGILARLHEAEGGFSSAIADLGR
jgi:hypothetical protein